MAENLEANSARRVIPEDRLGLDGKWDIGLGLWFEATFIRQKDDILAANRQRAFTLGLDYTFDLGHGLYALAEYYEMSFGKGAWTGAGETRFVVFSLSYPVSLLDNLMAFAFFDHKNGDTNLFFRWQ